MLQLLSVPARLVGGAALVIVFSVLVAAALIGVGVLSIFQVVRNRLPV